MARISTEGGRDLAQDLVNLRYILGNHDLGQRPYRRLLLLRNLHRSHLGYCSMSAPTGLSHTRSDTAGKAHLLIPFAEVVAPITPYRPQSLAEMLLLTLICKESSYCRKRQMGRLIWTTQASLVLPVTVHRYLRQTALASVIANPR